MTRTPQGKLIGATILVAVVLAFVYFVFAKVSGALDREQTNVWVIQVAPFAVMALLLIFIFFRKDGT